MSALTSLSMWQRLVAARIRSDWQYRASFGMYLTSQAVVAGLDLAVIGVLFSNVDTLAGWRVEEVVLIYALATTAFGIADTLVSPVETVATHIKAGTFDVFLLRPLPPLVHVVASEFALRRIGRTVQPIVVLLIALAVGPVEWSVETAVLLPVAIVCGAMIFGAVWVMTASISFWTVDGQEVANAFTYGGGVAAQYPTDVVGGWLRRGLTFVVPLAFVACLPAARLLGRDEAAGVPSAAAWAAPGVALVLCGVASAVWRSAIRHHRSTGS